MPATNRSNKTAFETPVQADNQEPALYSIEGKLQRVNYQEREFTLIAEGRLWRLVLCADSQLWFNGRVANFRCFHPLDHVRIFYESYQNGPVVQALYVWADEPARTE